MIKLNLYSAKGVKKGNANLPRDLETKGDRVLLAQAIRVYEDRLHPGLAKVKTRGEVAYSTRKIYRQKGTGGARHGSRGAPIFVKGGRVHGPTGVKRKLKLTKKLSRKALRLALTLKAKDGELILIDNVSSLQKTKEVASLINTIVASRKEVLKNPKIIFILSDKNKGVLRVLRNIKNVDVVYFRNLNAYQVFYGRTLLLDKDALEESRKSSKGRTSSKGKKKKGK